MRAHVHVLVAAVALLAGAGCTSTPALPEADAALGKCVREWEREKSGDASPSDLANAEIVHDPERLRKQFEQLALAYPNHVPTLMANAIVAYDARLVVPAQQYLDRLLTLAPAHAGATALRARIAAAEGDLHLARRLLEDGIRLVPDDAGLWETRAGVLHSLGRDELARASLDTAGRLGAPGWRVAYLHGLIEESSGHPLEAERAYETALAARSDFPAAASRLRALKASEPQAAATAEPVDRQVEAAAPTTSSEKR